VQLISPANKITRSSSLPATAPFFSVQASSRSSFDSCICNFLNNASNRRLAYTPKSPSSPAVCNSNPCIISRILAQNSPYISLTGRSTIARTLNICPPIVEVSGIISSCRKPCFIKKISRCAGIPLRKSSVPWKMQLRRTNLRRPTHSQWERSHSCVLRTFFHVGLEVKTCQISQ